MGERLRATGTPEQDVEPLAELLAEDLAEWPEDAWLAFDHYQFACESPFAEEFVERVLALCPLKLFLTSRKRPTWATSRRLLYGDFYEMGRSLLAIESRRRRRKCSRTDSGSQAIGLVALADGWPAVIGLAALTEQMEVPDEGLPEALYAYFAEELYQTADPEIRWWLSRLSLSSSVAPAVAEAVLGGRGGTRLHRWPATRIPRTVRARCLRDPSPLRAFLEDKFREPAGDRAPTIVELLVRTHVGREEWDDAFSIVERFFDAALLVEIAETALTRSCSRRGSRRSRAGWSALSSTRLARRSSTSRRVSSVPRRGPDALGGTRTPGSETLRRGPSARLALLRACWRQCSPLVSGRGCPYYYDRRKQDRPH